MIRREGGGEMVRMRVIARERGGQRQRHSSKVRIRVGQDKTEISRRTAETAQN